MLCERMTLPTAGALFRAIPVSVQVSFATLEILESGASHARPPIVSCLGCYDVTTSSTGLFIPSLLSKVTPLPVVLEMAIVTVLSPLYSDVT